MSEFRPEEWLSSALSLAGAAQAFKVVSSERVDSTPTTYLVRVLHKDTGAVWRFHCAIERSGVL